jgi:hypothetical protein
MPTAARGPSEAEVALWLKLGLRRGDLGGRQPSEIIVDRDGSYVSSPFRRQLEPMGSVEINGWQPDLVCLLGDEPARWVAAFEVKAERDHEKGLVQASRYGDGAHEAYLCVPALDGAMPLWLSEGARRNGVGLIRASPERIDVEVVAARPRPDPLALAATRRYLEGESGVRALILNSPLHYAAALVAVVQSDRPWEALRDEWGLGESAVRLAARGAETLGLIRDERATLKGKAYADTLLALGFELRSVRPLTRKRLVEQAPGFAALLRAVLLDHPPVQLIMRALRAAGSEVTADRLAGGAHALDHGMAQAVFGPRPAPGEAWVLRPTTRFQLKAALYDTGLLDSPLGKGASGPQAPGGYNPRQDVWRLGAAGDPTGSL